VAYRDQETTGRRLRGLLALLAGDPRTGRGTARLVEGRWPDELPEHPAKALQVVVSRAGPAGRGCGGSIHGSGRPCDLSGTSPAEHWIIMRESSGYPTADNPASTAFGLGQLLLGNRILYLGEQYATTDCGRQLWAFRAYVCDRYGTSGPGRSGRPTAGTEVAGG
jgi:hypothetical protein